MCTKEWASKLEICSDVPEEEVQNKILQRELLKMYVDDQFDRGNRMDDIINKYQLDTSEITVAVEMSMDLINRNKLKEIIEKYGFPTRKLIGKDAMR